MTLRRSLRLRNLDAERRDELEVENSSLSNSRENSEQTPQDQFAFLDTEKHPTDGEGLACQLHTYDVRTNAKGDHMFLQIGCSDEFYEDKRSRSYEAAMVLKRNYNYERNLESTQLEIQSPYLKKAFRDVIGSYPGVNVNSDAHIYLFDEPKCLFHYREELKAYSSASDDEQAKKHIKFCLEYMARFFKRELVSFNHMMSDNATSPGLEHASLWMAFKPGDILYQKVNGTESLVRMVRMTKEKEDNADSGRSKHYWCVRTQRLQWNGTELGFVKRFVNIDYYDGHKPLTNLRIFPLRYHIDSERLREEAVSRGKRYVSLLDIHHCHYEGIANMWESSEYLSLSVSNRIIIDAKEFNTNVSSKYTKFMAGEKLFQPKLDGRVNLIDDELVVCHHILPGFSLHHKRWALFDVDKIQDLEYNTNAFEELAMPQQKKDLISSLLTAYEKETLHFDDIIKGKGRGLIFLLHGPPGVGKTLTAESIADRTRRPLYVLGAGDLGGFGSRVETKLNNAMHLATRWNAAILIDEADVFMEERTDNEILRNELVSVLLRSLEYYQGIMFLTTNRMGSIDSAFKSRVHLALSFPPLSFEYRRQLWKRFLVNSFEPRPHFLTEKYLDEISKEEINGRQIKNIVRLSFALATSSNRQMEPRDVEEGLQSLISFERDFAEAQRKRSRPIENGVQKQAPKKQFFGLF